MAAWAALVTWGASPYARYLDHGGLDRADLGGPALAAVVMGGWTLMVVAMMVPTVLPLVSMLAAVGSQRDQRRRLPAALVAGYLATWVSAGALMWVADSLLHTLESRFPPLDAASWLLAPGSLVLAGAFQLSSLKERCLRQCRSPRAMLLAGWRGQRPLAESFLLGVEHGRFCVGCCWALMLVMFAVGSGNLGVMLALAAVMAGEKLLSRGDALGRPVAGLLFVAAAASVAVHLW